jgi:branched-chain amino acid transport system permease protein
MDGQIAAILAQDGITSGAVYALLALALVLVFSVTRVIFIPQGEFVAFGAMALAAIQAGTAPALSWLLLALGAAVFLLDLPAHLSAFRTGRRPGRAGLARSAGVNLLFPIALHILLRRLPLAGLPLPLQALLVMLLVAPMGSMLYRLVYRRLSEASTLVLLIVSVAVHFMLTGVGLLAFGAEGVRAQAFSDATFNVGGEGGLALSGQAIVVVLTAAVLIAALYLYFGRTLSGKALRAAAVNRRGARLVGIGSAQSGQLAFGLAAAIGALSGILVAPITTIFYDSGFLIGLKGFVGAIVGGLISFPLAAAGALLVGLLEAFSSFWASSFKEVIVFTLIIPVLMWRSLSGAPTGDEH